MVLIAMLEKISEKLHPLFERINVGYFGIISTVSGALTILIASILYFPVESFNFTTHWISNLGGIITNSGEAPNYSYVIFSIGLTITAIFTTLFITGLIRDLLSTSQDYKSLVSTGFIVSLFSLIGILGVAFFNMKSFPVIHTYFAISFFFGSSLMMILFSLAILMNENYHWLVGVIGLFLASPAVLFELSFIPHLLEGKDITSLVVSTGPEMALSRILEWIFVFNLFIWLFEIGLYKLNKKKSNI